VSPTSPLGGGPTWSPNSNAIALTSTRDGNPEIYTVTPAGGSLTRLTDNPAADLQPAWSTTGDIDFVSSRDGNPEIYARTLGSGGKGGALVQFVRLTANSAVDTEPSPLSDGSKIAFVSNRDGNAEIYALTLATKVLTRLTTNSGADLSPSWQPL
jgi:Tol biopolymer transport system component